MYIVMLEVERVHPIATLGQPFKNTCLPIQVFQPGQKPADAPCRYHACLFMIAGVDRCSMWKVGRNRNGTHFAF